ncbi:MAG: hypothetical protein SFY32_16710 [Bacteroidota bacterium]|nr:hypothetical protein [Bacteroidota bacterium]
MDTEKIKNRALTKLMICFSDEKVRYFYSLDSKANIERKNQMPGIYKLEKMLFGQFSGKWSKAILFDNLTKEQIKNYD